MGTYGVSIHEMVSSLSEVLDDIEGDFDRATLVASLEILKGYHPVMDETMPKDYTMPPVSTSMGPSESIPPSVSPTTFEQAMKDLGYWKPEGSGRKIQAIAAEDMYRYLMKGKKDHETLEVP